MLEDLRPRPYPPLSGLPFVNDLERDGATSPMADDCAASTQEASANHGFPHSDLRQRKPHANITILLLNWRRPGNLALVIRSIEQQTIRPPVFLWNNGARFAHPSIDWQVESSLNKRCWPRWTLGAMAETDYVCSLDDDFAFGDDRVLEDLLEYLDHLDHPDRAVGAAGVVLYPEKPYAFCRHVGCFHKTDVPVDIVKGKLFACRTDALRATRMIGCEREDDIALSGMLARGRPQFHRVAGIFYTRMHALPELDIGLCQDPVHQVSRERARRTYCVV
jgi:hypothetical protein